MIGVLDMNSRWDDQNTANTSSYTPRQRQKTNHGQIIFLGFPSVFFSHSHGHVLVQNCDFLSCFVNVYHRASGISGHVYRPCNYCMVMAIYELQPVISVALWLIIHPIDGVTLLVLRIGKKAITVGYPNIWPQDWSRRATSTSVVEWSPDARDVS